MSDQDRIDQLAAQVRRLRWMNYGMAAVIAAGAMLAAGALQQVSPIVRAKTIEVVSDSGRTVLTLTSDPEGSGILALKNNKGEVVAMLSTVAYGAALSLRNNKGQETVMLAVLEDGGALNVCNNKGQRAASLHANTDLNFLTLYNDKAEPRASLSAGRIGGALFTYDGTGRKSGRVP